MKVTVPGVCYVLAVAMGGAGLLLGSPVFVVSGLVVAGIGLFTNFAQKGKVSRQDDPADMGAEARWLLRPIRELREGLAKIVQQSANSPEVGVIAQEAIVEADGIYQKAIELVRAREGLKKSLKGRGEAETNLGRLERQLATAGSDGEKTALESAVAARKEEIAAYDSAQGRVQEIDSRLNQAEATLAELKAKLMTGMVGVGTVEGHQDEFNEMVQRLKTLGQSFEEAQGMLEVQSS